MSEDPNKLTVISGEEARVYKDTWLEHDLGQKLGDCFRVTSTGLEVVGIPSKDQMRDAVLFTTSMHEATEELNAALRYALGDAILELEARYGDETVQDVLSVYIKDKPKTQALVKESLRVCRKVPREQRLPIFTATHELSWLKGKVSEDEWVEAVEWAKKGDKIVVDGEVKKQEARTCQEIRQYVQEKTGKGPNVRATVKDPTGDAERLRKAEEVCKAIQNIQETLPERFSLFPPCVVRVFADWQEHMAQKGVC